MSLSVACNTENSREAQTIMKTPECISLEDTKGYDIRENTPKHASTFITQMCYTKTIDDANNSYNPCYACHTQNRVPNYVLGDEALQEAYSFPSPALTNPFSNNFIDFSQRVSEISDTEIIEYLNKSNYFDVDKNIILTKKLNNLSEFWDVDGDSVWSGYNPDCYYNFNEFGFDIDSDNRATGWVAFAYMPFLGTFFPTNGATDDVLIRLDSSFMKENKESEFNATIYTLNLSIVESLIKQKDIPISPVNEKSVAIDLNKNGIFDIAKKIVYKWEPNNGEYMSYVGYAKELLNKGKIHLAGGLYPENTEFLHSVRYIKSGTSGTISLAPRMKELRYAKKTTWLTYANLQNRGMATVQDKDLNPDAIETFRGDMEHGLGNNMGWVYQGFIEDKNGNLRPQSYEEILNCMGCHSGIGATTDSTFSLPRKLNNSFQNGWYHPTQKSLQRIPDTLLATGEGEYARYLKLNPYSDEFRENNQVYNKFHIKNGELNTTLLTELQKDVTVLLYPSHERALKLNKGYKALVELQQFYNGKAGHIEPMINVYRKIKDAQSTHLQRIVK